MKSGVIHAACSQPKYKSKHTKFYACKYICRVSSTWVFCELCPCWSKVISHTGVGRFSQLSLSSHVSYTRCTVLITVFLEASMNTLAGCCHSGREGLHCVTTAPMPWQQGDLWATLAAPEALAVLPGPPCILQTCLPSNFFNRMVLLISGAFELLKDCVTFN